MTLAVLFLAVPIRFDIVPAAADRFDHAGPTADVALIVLACLLIVGAHLGGRRTR